MQSEHRPADGAMDFAGFSTAQLRDLEYTIDREAYPLNYHNLRLELQRRDEETAAALQPLAQWPAEFTAHAGLRGWLEGKARGLALYGAGSVEPGAGELLLRGGRRTWLGVGCKVELSIAFEKILNVAQEDRLVRFEVQQRLRRRRFELRLESAEEASRLAALLPVTRTPAFDRDWRELHEFSVSLRRTSPHAWVTPSLVALNSVVFLAMAVTQRRLYGFDLQQLVSWGANYGPHMPRWGGSYQKVDEFISAIYEKTWPSEGTQMYTQLYWMYGLMEGDDVNIFIDAHAEWSFMNPGFKQLLARYPRSDYVLNAYADFACRAGDKAQYQALRPELATRFSASAWTKKFTLQACDGKFGLPSPAGSAPQAGKAGAG